MKFKLSCLFTAAFSLSCVQGVVLTGFTYCGKLEASEFKPKVSIVSPKDGINWPDGFGTETEALIAFVEKRAKDIVTALSNRKVISLYDDRWDPISPSARVADRSQLVDYACYMAATGYSRFFRLKDSPLVAVAPDNYFPNVGFGRSTAETPAARISGSSASKCKIGYLILAHRSVDLVKRLVKSIMNPEAIVLIYVDGKAKPFKEKVESVVSSHEEWPNVHVMKDTIPVYWGHSSIVEAQHAGFFKLQDLGACEYYINLSANDMPLYSFDYIYSQLNKTAGKSWFDNISNHVPERFPSIDSKISGPSLSKRSSVGENNLEDLSKTDSDEDSSSNSKPVPDPYEDSDWELMMMGYLSTIIKAEPDENGLSYAGYLDSAMFYPGTKSTIASQWMMLTNDFVTLIRTKNEAIMLLAQYQWYIAPDERFYRTFAELYAPGTFKTRGPTYTKWQRYIPDMNFVRDLETPQNEEYLHPITLDENPKYLFEARARGYLFARKFKNSNSTFLKLSDLTREAVEKRRTATGKEKIMLSEA